nr:hypothetical protein [Desulfobacterales bacterium]
MIDRTKAADPSSRLRNRTLLTDKITICNHFFQLPAAVPGAAGSAPPHTYHTVVTAVIRITLDIPVVTGLPCQLGDGLTLIPADFHHQ